MLVRSLVVGLVAAALAGPGLAVPAVAGEASHTNVVVYFTRGEQLAPVRRPGAIAPLRAALRALLRGPTPAERRAGMRSAIPPDVELRGVDLEGGIASIDLSRAFATGRNGGTARLAQIVYTATQFRTVRAVRLLVGGRPLARLPGARLALGEPLVRADLGPHPYRPPAPPAGAPGVQSVIVEGIQEELIRLGFLPRGAADGVYGQHTRHAILAFQGWQRLRRDGRPRPALRSLLEEADVPRPARGWARHVEVSLARQVALFVDRGRVVRVVHVSTGRPGYETPRGSFRVFRKELRSWSVPYRVWLPYASYFTGGVAFHEGTEVPTYPASHGCVRVPAQDARWVYGFARFGTRVDVL